MRILIVSHLALPHVGGVENLVDLEVRGLAAAGHEVTLCTSDGSGAGLTPHYPTNVQIIHVPAWHFLERNFGIPYPIFGPRLLAILHREIARADVVHVHGFMFMNSAFAVTMARFQGQPCILTDHGGIQKFGSRLATLAARLGAETIGRLSASCATRLVAYNGRIQRTLNRLGRRKDAEFVPNPINGDLFYPPTAVERDAARRLLGWEPRRKKVLFIGR
ncbi:MAG TPA: glycosyltransferase, partial [Urbifossiella sp.]